MKCKICNKTFKQLTFSHVKTHKLTLKQYNEQFEPSKARVKSLVTFINTHYITVRYRFIEYKNDKTYTVNYPDNRSWKLCDTDIKNHLKRTKTIGIYFPEYCSKFIGLDIDTQDVELLNRVYSAVKSYGIDDDNFLISSSGNKGYHFDIFLSEATDKSIINMFYKILLNDTGITKKQVELRGGGGQGYKLPLGCHQKTGKYCFPCDHWGNEISLDYIPNIKKLSAKYLHEIVDINYSPIASQKNELMIKANDLFSDIDYSKIYDKNNANRLQNVQELIEKGVQKIGKRHVSIREVSAYCKDHKNLCISKNIEFVTNWVNRTWKKSIIDKQLLNSIKDTVKSIYKTNYKFYVSIEPRIITYPEIKEILSIKTNHKLETDAIRKLYFILAIHSKAYANKEQIFSMSYQQIQNMGGTKNNPTLARQLTKLSELGKIIIIERNVKNPNAGKKGQKLNSPNKYKLPFFQPLELKKTATQSFNICNDPKCKDCMEKALCYLLSNKERVKYIKGKKYKNLEKCKNNKDKETAPRA